MKALYSLKTNFLLFLVINIGLIISQINDNFEKGELEDGNYDLLDVTDYHNLGLIVSSSKSIYTGIPPVNKTETDANLFKFSHLITINTNYLLVACLEDSFLGKINLSTGRFTSLLSYSQIENGLSSLRTSQLPDAICSLSNIDDTIFIGFSQILDTNESYNTIFKFTLENKDDTNEGPLLANSITIESFFFAQLSIETTSLRQISCEPLKLLDNPNDYRLICLFLSISHYTYNNNLYTEYDLFAKTVKPDFDETNFHTNLRDNELTNNNKGFGFRIYREDSTHARCLTGNSLIEIYLDTNAAITKTSFSSASYNLNSEIDLISYNNEFIFSAQIISYMNIDNIFSFQINQKTYNNYFRLNDLEETIVHKIMGYFDNVQNKIMLLYQTENKIKFFIMDNKEEIYSLPTLTHTLQMYSFQSEIQYDLNNLITTQPLSNLGNLNVEQIKKKINDDSYEYQYFGIDFDQLIMDNNILIAESSLNDWKTYNLSFIEKVEGQYIRIYHLASLTINIETCKSDCFSCYQNYDTCTDCTNDTNLAPIEDKTYECYPPTYLIVKYIYDQESNLFRKCYQSCEFCTAVSTNPLDQKCSSCLPGYLHSYKYQGSCFPYTNLEITEDKEVDINQEEFISSTCSQYKIASTGECIETCPLTSIYFTYEYNIENDDFDKVFYDSPKYSFGNKCYEQCPENSNANENNECICNYYFFKDNDGNIICLSDENCPSDYPYLNQDTKECFSSLENCNYFFIDTCYETNCPTNTILLSTQSEEVKNYIKEKLSLNDNLVNKICICDTTNNGVWSNINVDTPYYQECLNSCPSGYIPEPITKQCIIDPTPPTPQPPLPNDQDDKCPVKYQNICYKECPEGTCLTQEDPKLQTCINKSPLMQVFNGICFEHFEDITNNIKAISDNEQVITEESGVIIHAYPAKKKKEKAEDKKSKYSFVNLGDCEKKIISYYNLPENTELFILGIDSPNKDIFSSSNVFNYGVYLQNGTLLDHKEACKDTKIEISTPITNPELIKLKEAVYFSDMGYDIFDENSDFYKDQCAPASIEGNDIILLDRKKDFYPEGISLCNDSCHYSEVDLDNKRFTCECDLNYDFSQKNKKEKKKNKNEDDDESYVDYFLSLINYKIIKCYKLFFDYKSYYYNIGFYISVGTLIFCSLQIYIFSNCGKKSMDLIILKNVPDERRLKELIKEQQKRSNELVPNKDNENNPPKKNVKFEFKDDFKDKRKLKLRKNKTLKILKSSKNIKTENPNKKILRFNSKEKLKFQTSNEILTNNNINIVNGISFPNISNESLNNEDLSKDNLNSRELNILPYSQALRTDKRNYFQIFLSVLSHEIKIISIFYYRHPYEHISIILSEYIFELCLDLTFNCFLYTEDVISEKYNNNGSIRFFTTLSLSFISNIISSIISYFLWKLANYAEFLEFIIKDVNYKSKYYLNIMRFKKFLCIKLSAFFFLQILINLAMCYYLMIFCSVYHNTQGSVLINYLTGVIESIIISFAFTLIISILRTISIKCRSKSAYYTSKYFFDNF